MFLPKNTNRFIKKLKKEYGDIRMDKKIVIFNSFTADYKLDANLSEEIYDITKLPIKVPEDIHEFFALSRIYYDQIKIASYLPNQILVMNYCKIAAEILKNLREENSEMPHVKNWQICSFFLEDEYIRNLKINNTSLLDIKADEILSMLEYPFIKKFEFPLHYYISTDNFFKLVNSNLN